MIHPKEIIKKHTQIKNEINDFIDNFINNKHLLDVKNLFIDSDVKVSTWFSDDENELHFLFGDKVLIYNYETDVLSDEEDNELLKEFEKEDNYKNCEKIEFTDKDKKSLLNFKENFKRDRIHKFFQLKNKLKLTKENIEKNILNYKDIDAAYHNENFKLEDLNYYNNVDVFERLIVADPLKVSFYRLYCDYIELVKETDKRYNFKFKLKKDANNLTEAKTLRYENGKNPSHHGFDFYEKDKFFLKNINKDYIKVFKKSIFLCLEIDELLYAKDSENYEELKELLEII